MTLSILASNANVNWYVRDGDIGSLLEPLGFRVEEHLLAAIAAKRASTPRRHVLCCQRCRYTYKSYSTFAPRYCPKCGSASDDLHELFGSLLSNTAVRELDLSVQQFQKREYVAAARTSLITLEELVRRKTGLSAVGVDLISQAFTFKKDGTVITRAPLIRINDLATKEMENEHEGIKLLFLGITKGLRNIIAHHNAELQPNTCLSILLLANMGIDLISHGSILDGRVCIWRRAKRKD